MTKRQITKDSTSADVREYLLDAMHMDLVGPSPDSPTQQEEIVKTAPSKWYLTGFLVPTETELAERVGEDEDEQLDVVSRMSAGDDEVDPEKSPSSKQSYFPSSMGLSVLVPYDLEQLEVTAFWGEYTQLLTSSKDRKKKKERPWKRTPHEESLYIDISPSEEPQMLPFPTQKGISLAVSVRDVPEHITGHRKARSISIFLVNQRSRPENTPIDKVSLFQTRLRVKSGVPFVYRPDVRGKDLDDWDEKVADLQYRHDYEYAVGHNVSVDAKIDSEGTDCFEIQTTWIPRADVAKVLPKMMDKKVQLGMEELAAAPNAQSAREMLSGLIEEYKEWIQRNRTYIPQEDKRKQVAEDLLRRAEVAQKRIEAGLQRLDDPQIFQAFTLMNKVMATAAKQRFSVEKNVTPEEITPVWRPFQLAFVLMNIQGIADPTHQERHIVDLLFFPTGGGKTEAYLGLAAFTLLLRRLRNPGIRSAGLSVLMRYTLRLLTLDQLGRATILVCALELERRANQDLLGEWPFEIGLWVGQSATANRMGQKGDKDEYTARKKTLDFQKDDKRHPSPIPLADCPWCGHPFTNQSFQLVPDADHPKDLKVECANHDCTYGIKKGRRGIQRLPLPIVSVDEPIYRRLPCFIIATVDKFANLPWVGHTGGFFGKVHRYDKDGFYGPCNPGEGHPLGGPLLPPDLIIQDELHLISGPLGTMVGLYETALDTLSGAERDDITYYPKNIASTATVRRATSQIRALFGRSEVDIFPPPGPNRTDSFFAYTESTERANPRTYIGIAAPGRSMKVVLLRTYLTLLGAAQRAWQDAGGKRNQKNPADPYMTLLGYFGSLRELGGSRRIVEDEVNARLMSYDDRLRVGESKQEGWFAKRKIDDSPVELTSRVSTSDVAKAKRKLSLDFHEKGRVDVALATNMISVGLDITRLGLMVVLGQPKMTAEYIQATSRVGRDEKRPGLVITLLNTYRPRDRSHYERFKSWHTSFYRAVEATSVTPFSPRALERGLAGVTVALARLGLETLTAPRNALDITLHRSKLNFVAEALSRRAEHHNKEISSEDAEKLRQEVRALTEDLLDTWDKIATEQQEAHAGLQYQREEGRHPPLLYTPLDPALAELPRYARKFKAQRSLRDVEQTVNLWLRSPNSTEGEG
ncbi:MAG: helicase [Deltaproteobacteria bacterium]|nr:helicase [Deltaproteobacteria bacterium]|tara:strand:- start:5749 stop:9189 length:3441 start_codon:yes stop_codon:yes gene_type:complete